MKPITVLFKSQFHFLSNTAKSLVLIQGLQPLRFEVAGGSQGEEGKINAAWTTETLRRQGGGALRGARVREASPVPLTESFDRAPLCPSSVGAQGPELPQFALEAPPVGGWVTARPGV